MTSILTNPRERTRFLKFAAVGIIGAAVDFGVANLLLYAFSAPLVTAGTISFLAAVTSNFLWNRYWTYPDSRSKHVLHQFAVFTIVNAIGLAIRIPVLHLLEEPLKLLFEKLALPFFPPDFLGKNLTLATAMIIVMLWNFFANRYVTYNDVE